MPHIVQLNVNDRVLMINTFNLLDKNIPSSSFNTATIADSTDRSTSSGLFMKMPQHCSSVSHCIKPAPS